jgi:transposase-like protein
MPLVMVCVMGLVMPCQGRAPSFPPAREGRRRRFSEAGKRQILREAMRPDSRFSEVARRYGIAERVLFRWKQEMPSRSPDEGNLLRTQQVGGPDIRYSQVTPVTLVPSRLS